MNFATDFGFLHTAPACEHASVAMFLVARLARGESQMLAEAFRYVETSNMISSSCNEKLND